MDRQFSYREDGEISSLSCIVKPRHFKNCFGGFEPQYVSAGQLDSYGHFSQPRRRLVIRAHNSEIPGQTTSPFSNPYTSMEKTGVEEEWNSYTKHFFWKHQTKLIPKYDKIVTQVPEEPIIFIQGIVNARRKEHFVGIDDSMTLRGVDARRATEALSFHAVAEATEASTPERDEKTPVLVHPVQKKAMPFAAPVGSALLQDNHKAQLPAAAVKTIGCTAFLPLPMAVTPLCGAGDCTLSGVTSVKLFAVSPSVGKSINGC